MQDSRQVINIITDGSCLAKINAGGYCSVIFLNQKKFVESRIALQKSLKQDKYNLNFAPLNNAIILKGNRSGVTNNEMEILAFILALRYLDNKGLINKDVKIIVYTDSAYLEKLLKGNSLFRYYENRWRGRNNKKLANLELVKELYDFSTKTTISCRKVKAHANDALNICADYFAKEQVQILKEEFKTKNITHYKEQLNILNEKLRRTNENKKTKQ